ncbi:hypothetical protein DSO57_1021724 [Entomophthora muscae]|uniref:Uncharacterized protein n=1 Tax=Entomophthora muscae TaxID=34485 RepID=A0ACC2UN70_9FUNG|nr:hypothetical protein DSO57_1021724 [Entomophthora muscae]
MHYISVNKPLHSPEIDLLNKFALLNIDEDSDNAKSSLFASTQLTEPKANLFKKRSKKKSINIGATRGKYSEESQSEEQVPLKDLRSGWRLKKRYVVCVDFEATCEADVPFNDSVHEIIEFPAIAIDTLTNEKVAEFHSYVKPTKNSVISDFCTKLTGITQDVVNKSPNFSDVLSKFLVWIDELLSGKFLSEDRVKPENLETSSEESFTQISGLIFATHGQADILKFLITTCKINKIPLPDIFKEPFIDIQKTACKIFKKNIRLLKESQLRTKSGKPLKVTHSVSLQNLCHLFHIPFVGRCHSGLDDARMVATILQNWALSEYTILPNSS